MKNINIFIKENIKSICPEKVYVSPNIPEKILNNAISSFGFEGNYASILAIYDNTRFGNAKDGIIFTGEKLIYKEAFQDKIEISYKSIVFVEHRNQVVSDNYGTVKESIVLTHEDSSKYKLHSLSNCDYTKLNKIVNSIHYEFDSYTNENQLITLSEMSDPLKEAYIKIIINMTFEQIPSVHKNEFAQVLLLIARLDLSNKTRISLRSYLNAFKPKDNIQELLTIIDSEAVDSHKKSIRVSLTKDLISTFMSANNNSYKNFDYLNKNQRILEVSDEEITLAAMSIKNDYDMLRIDISEEEIEKSIKELEKTAGSIGLPLASVYLSGSSVGMSAAGLTTGLASIGLGGVLGFSSMATGIGVGVILGVASYQGVRHLTGANELDEGQHKVLMLNDVIKQTQYTNSLLIDDINLISIQLNVALQEPKPQRDKIVTLLKLMTLMTGSGQVLKKKCSTMERSVSKLKCPSALNIKKLNSLTAEPTKAPLFNIIIEFYEERLDYNELGVAIDTYTLKENLTTKELMYLAEIIEGLGYFNVTDVLTSAASDFAEQAKDTASDIASQAKNKLTDLLGDQSKETANDLANQAKKKLAGLFT